MSMIVSIVGESNSGKTTLIEKLINRCKSDDIRVAVIKHTAGGYELKDKDGSDSDKFTKSGADYVMVKSAKTSNLFILNELPLEKAIFMMFNEVDLIILEGFKEFKVPYKILVVREKEDIPTAIGKDISCLYSRNPIETSLELDVFSEETLDSMFEKIQEQLKVKAMLFVNGKKIPMKDFIEEMVTSVVKGVVVPLNLPDRVLYEIDVKIKL